MKCKGCIQSFMLPWKLRKRHILPVNQNLSSVSACELQPFSCHDLANYIYQEPGRAPAYTHKLPDLCSATLIGACHGTSYRIHSSSTDQRIRNPVSLESGFQSVESRIQDSLRLQDARYKILFG